MTALLECLNLIYLREDEMYTKFKELGAQEGTKSLNYYYYNNFQKPFKIEYTTV